MKVARLLFFGVFLAVLSACGTMQSVTVSKMGDVQVSSLEGNKVNISMVGRPSSLIGQPLFPNRSAPLVQ